MAYSLSRIFAYAVLPQKHAEMSDRADPTGGPIRLAPRVRAVIENAFAKIATSVLTTVDLDTDDDRKHPVRDDVMDMAFGATNKPRAASMRLAVRLAATMDNRSHSALLLLVVEEDGAKRRVSMLVLPREDVVQLKGKADDLLLDLIQDAFSTGSGLRKLARLEGHNGRTQFLSAEVLDLQLMSANKSVADFWIREFLHALPRMDAATGTKTLVAALQRAFDAASEEDRDGVFAAILAASSGRVRRTSLETYARQLPDELVESYFRGIEDGEIRRTVFDVDQSLIRTALARRVITAKDGVIVSAPADVIGKSVELKQEGDLRVIRYSGMVEKERVARRRAGDGE